MKYFSEVAEKQIYPTYRSGKQCDCSKQGVVISGAHRWMSEAREVTRGGNPWDKQYSLNTEASSLSGLQF